MDPDAVERKLAAILSADVVGYSRLMAEDEAATIRTLTEYRDQIAMLVRQHRGRVVDSPGDNLLAEFPTALDAVQGAVEIQRVIQARNADLPAERRMEFRIGVHMGDVSVEGDRIYGDGVNIAARLEGLAEAGGICISGTVHEQVESKLDLGYEDLGEQHVKNIPKPLRVFRVHVGAVQGGVPRAVGGRGRRVRTVVGVALTAVLLVGVGLWATWPRPLGLLIDALGVSGPPINPPLPDKPSIVVLPFTNMSGDPEQEYFSDGITEDLTTELSRNDALFVISRSSAFSYKGQPVIVETVARELGVRYVLEGSVRKVGDRVRITAQLIDARNSFHLWSERYDRRLTDIFALQTELAQEIQTNLRVAIRDAEIARTRLPETRDVDAYDALLRGLFHFQRFRRDDNLEARRWFARAVELDPDFASAHAMYGNTHGIEYGFGWSRDPGLLVRAEDAARRALQLDIASSDAWNTLANVHLARGEYEAAVTAAEQGIAAEPNFEIPHVLRGMALAAQGRILPALASIRRALRLNPRPNPGQRLAIAFVNYRAGQIDEAIALLEEARAENPDLILARLFLIRHRDSEGRGNDARVLAEEVLRINPDLTAEEGERMLVGFEALEPLRRAGLPRPRTVGAP